MDAERVFFAGPRFPAAAIELRVRASVVSVFAANIDDSIAALLAAASGAEVIIFQTGLLPAHGGFLRKLF